MTPLRLPYAVLPLQRTLRSPSLVRQRLLRLYSVRRAAPSLRINRTEKTAFGGRLTGTIYGCNNPPKPVSAEVVGEIQTASSLSQMTLAKRPASTSFSGAMPKEEIGALQFIQENPSYDGRGTVIAIFDSGVDPGAPGLQITTERTPKIIDVIDCTGSGDIDTSKVVKAEDGCVVGASGKTLKLNEEWTNPSGEWRVGCVQAFSLFTQRLTNRLKAERRKDFDADHRMLYNEAVQALTTFDGANPKVDEEGKLQRAELKARVDGLQALMDAYADSGPVLDCVVWHDGSTWRAAVDSSELYNRRTGPGGALADCPALANFSEELCYGTLSPVDACNYAVNIYDEGKILSLVIDASPHGTHVAGITAAFHPEDPELNGIAPGAQIISCKIGDSRLGSMETGVGCTRALAAVIKHKCHLINMSYGEPASVPNRGRFIDLSNEVVQKHGVVFVSSAGNEGPALSTAGAPGGTSSAIISVGAYVTPALAAAGHSLREDLQGPQAEGQQYTWSSRGPTTDGHLGVTISAPGGAIAPVPQWTLEKRQLMNGTSMASPCACGGIALLLSAALQEGLAATPAVLRRAVENSALPVGGPCPTARLTNGRGLLQVGAALEALRKGGAEALEVWYDVAVQVAGSSSSGRGLYLREPQQWAGLGAVEARVTVTPHLHEDLPNDRRHGFEQRILLSSTADWLRCPANCLLTHGGRGFGIRAELAQVPEGTLAYGEVVGVDAERPEAGPVFRVPCTLVRPLQLAREASGALARASFPRMPMSAGHEERVFVAVPDTAQWVEVTVRGGAMEAASDDAYATDCMDAPRSYLIHANHAAAATRLDDNCCQKFMSLSAGEAKSWAFKVVPGTTLEVVVAQFWLSLGAGDVSMDLAFHSVVPSVGGAQAGAGAGAVLVEGAGGPTRVDCWAPLAMESVAPAAKLEVVRRALRPTKAELAPLPDARDELPDQRRILALHLTYSLELSEPGKITPRLPAFNRQVYDGEMEGQMYMIYDSNKQLLGTGDIYPEAHDLEKGTYTIRVELRHDDAALLGKLKAQPLLIDRALKDPIALPIAPSLRAATVGPKDFAKTTLPVGGRCQLFLCPVADDKLPADSKAADGAPATLHGSLTLGALAQQSGGGAAPWSAPLVYVPQPPAPKEDEPGAKAKEGPEEEDASTMLQEALDEAYVTQSCEVIKKLKKENAEQWAAVKELGAQVKEYLEKRALPESEPGADEQVAALKAASPMLTVLGALLAAADDAASRKDRLPDVVAAAEEVIAAVDTDALIRFEAMKCEEEGEVAEERKKLFAEHKKHLVAALKARCAALIDGEEGPGPDDFEGETPDDFEGAAPVPPPPPPSRSSGQPDDFEAAYAALKRWEDPAKTLLAARREARRARPALALAITTEVMKAEDGPAKKEVIELRVALLKELGWTHFEFAERASLIHRFPSGYRLF